MTNDKEFGIVLIDLNEASRRILESAVNEYACGSLNTESEDMSRSLSLIRKVRPAIVILNLYPDRDAGMDLAQKISMGFPEVTLFVTARDMSSDLILRAMRTGAREFLTQPIRKEELFTAIKKVIRAQENSRSGQTCQSRMITLFGTKGGVGTTTIATNVASSLATYTQKDVAVVDLNLQFGDAALLLNLKSKYSVLDIAKNLDHLDIALLKNMLPRTPYGVSMLSAPLKIEEAESLTGDHIEQILLLLRNMFEYIVVDVNRSMDDVTIKALDESDFILMITTMDVPAVYHAKRCIELFRKMGYDENKVRVVINRYNALEDLDPATIEKVLQYPVFWNLPSHDKNGILTAINKGIPVANLTPNAKLSQSFLKMIQNFNGALSSKSVTESDNQKVGIIQKILN